MCYKLRDATPGRPSLRLNAYLRAFLLLAFNRRLIFHYTSWLTIIILRQTDSNDNFLTSNKTKQSGTQRTEQRCSVKHDSKLSSRDSLGFLGSYLSNNKRTGNLFGQNPSHERLGWYARLCLDFKQRGLTREFSSVFKPTF